MENIFNEIGPAIAATFAGLFSYLGLLISKENRVSDFRQAWIDSLRDDLSRFVSSVSIASYGNAEKSNGKGMEFDEYHRTVGLHFGAAKAALTSIQLRINRKDKNPELKELNNALLAHLDKVTVLMREKKWKESRGAAYETHTLAAPIFKIEWERVKRGEPVFSFTKWAALGLFIVAILAGGCFMISGQHNDSDNHEPNCCIERSSAGEAPK